MIQFETTEIETPGVSYEEIARLYPDHRTRMALLRVVTGYAVQGVIEWEHAKAIMLLGEPTVYDALAGVKEAAESGVETVAA